MGVLRKGDPYPEDLGRLLGEAPLSDDLLLGEGHTGKIELVRESRGQEGEWVTPTWWDPGVLG